MRAMNSAKQNKSHFLFLLVSLPTVPRGAILRKL